MTREQVWEVTAVAALDKVLARFRAAGAAVDVVGLDGASATSIDRLDRKAALGGA